MLSVVVVFHNMRREARRTLFSLSKPYQLGVDEDEYEVIAIDNGSSAALRETEVRGFGGNFRYIFHPTQSVSPAEAVNHAAAAAAGEYLAIIVDGARMASPGLLRASLQALKLFPKPVVGSMSWHLGPDVQNQSMLEGYDQQREDQLLDSIRWPEDGYRLFEISTLAQSSHKGFLGGLPGELSWVCLSRATFDALGGFDQRFQAPGGGLINQHFRNKLVAEPGIQPVMLLGEGVFHQFHGGVATNVPMSKHPLHDFRAEYEHIIGKPFERAPTPPVTYLGTMPRSARRFINRDGA